MTVVETILVFAGAPLAIVAILAVLTLRPEKRHKRLRYKPGQAWEHPPVWYEPHPEHGPAAGHGETLAIGSSVYGERHDGGASQPVVGAGGTASTGAAPTAGTGARPHPGGPLGGARGTW